MTAAVVIIRVKYAKMFLYDVTSMDETLLYNTIILMHFFCRVIRLQQLTQVTQYLRLRDHACDTCLPSKYNFLT